MILFYLHADAELCGPLLSFNPPAYLGTIKSGCIARISWQPWVRATNYRPSPARGPRSRTRSGQLKNRLEDP